MSQVRSTLKSMVSTRAVSLGSGSLTVYGLGVLRFADLLLKHPAVQEIFTGGRDLDVKVLISEIPEFVVDCIAAALREEDDETKQDIADLPPEAVVTLIEAVIDATLPEGLDPFLARLQPILDKLLQGKPKAKARAAK